MEFQQIGILRTPFTEPTDMPIQPSSARGAIGRIEIDPAWEAALQDLDAFSHIIVLYHFHRAPSPRLMVTPFLDDSPHGLFATRAPCRPNPIGLSVLRLCRIDGVTVEVVDADMLDGSPVLDIKPYVPEFDQPSGPVRCGWLDKGMDEIAVARSDDRFADSNND